MAKTKKGCGFDGCDRPRLSRGYCDGHYRQLRKRGSVELLTPLQQRRTPEQIAAFQAGEEPKRCYDCGEMKFASDFNSDASNTDGHAYQCRSCGNARNAARAAVRRSQVCPVAACQEHGTKVNTAGRCKFHYHGGSESLCGCRSCSVKRSTVGRYHPRSVAQSELAADPVSLYLISCSDGGEQWMTFGLTRQSVAKRLSDYRRDIEFVELVAVEVLDALTASRAEFALKAPGHHLRHEGVSVEGCVTESLVDSAEAYHAVMETIEWARQAAATPDTCEHWLDQRADWLARYTGESET